VPCLFSKSSSYKVVGACGVPGSPGTVSGLTFPARATDLPGPGALPGAGLAAATPTWPNWAIAAASVTSRRAVTAGGRRPVPHRTGRHVLLGFLITPPTNGLVARRREPEINL
jgi:hypothetical protein